MTPRKPTGHLNAKSYRYCFFTDRSLQVSQQGTKTQGVTVFLQTDHSKQANRALKRKELLFLQTDHSEQANRALKRKKLLFFTDRSLQASQQGTKTQGVTVFTYRSLQASQQGTKTQGITVFFKTGHCKQANRALLVKRKELLFFTAKSLQASQ